MKKAMISLLLNAILQYSLAQNVGIGISNPGAKLHISYGNSGYAGGYYPGAIIEGNGNTYLNLLSPNSNETGLLFGKSSDAASGGIVYNNFLSPDGLLFRTNGNVNRFVISNNGFVGIGNLNPIAPLSFQSVVGQKITFFGDGEPNYGIAVQPYLLQIHTDAYISDIAFGFGSSSLFAENMRIKGNGNVGINTTVPSEKLQVNGKIKADAFTYPVPRTFYYSISPTAFGTNHASTGFERWENGVILTQGEYEYLVAPANLPQGAIITSVTVYFSDNNSTKDLYLYLNYHTHTSANFSNTLAQVSSSGAPGYSSATTTNILLQSPPYSPYNNQLGSLSIKVIANPLPWPANYDLILTGVVISYTLAETQ